MQNFDFNKVLGEKARWEQHAACYFEQNLKEAPYKTASVQPFASHLTNYSRKTSKTCSAWRSMAKHISNILLWTPTHGHTNVGLPGKTNIHQLCVDTGWHLENLSRAMSSRNRYWVSVKGIHAISMTWGWQLHIIIFSRIKYYSF